MNLGLINQTPVDPILFRQGFQQSFQQSFQQRVFVQDNDRLEPIEAVSNVERIGTLRTIIVSGIGV